MNEKPVVILITAATRNEAISIGRHLVKGELAACTNILSGVHSLFVWKKQFYEEDEVLLIVKTIQGKVEKIVSVVKELHSYDVPEIITVPIVNGSKDYLDWLRQSIT